MDRSTSPAPGRQRAAASAAQGVSSDAVRFRIAQNTRLLAGGSFEATNASVDGAIEIASESGLVAFSFPFGGSVLINSLNQPAEGPTDIYFFLRAALNNGVSTGRHSFDYTFTFDVEWIELPAPVPLPAGGLLLATALGAGVLLRRKRVTIA